MTDLLSALIIPEEVQSYLAILGLLLCWKLHALEIRHRRAVICYICLSENDMRTCQRCRMAHLHVFAGHMPREVGFRIHCSNRDGCRCALIPLTRQWPLARRLRCRIRRKIGSLQLSDQDLQGLLHEGANLSNHDQLAQTVLRAMLAEETSPEAALQCYRQVIADDFKSSNPLLRAAAYMRLARIHERSGEFKEALQVTRDFLKAFSGTERYYLLTKPQYKGIQARQSRLVRQLLQ